MCIFLGHIGWIDIPKMSPIGRYWRCDLVDGRSGW